MALAQLLSTTLLPVPLPSQKMSAGRLPWALLSRTVLFVGLAPGEDGGEDDDAAVGDRRTR
jgi:hypothetical protein